MHLTKVEISRILRTGPEADRFVFTYRPRLENLLSSIKKAGILHPPLLLKSKEGEGYQVICGSRRVEGLFQLGKQEINAFVVDQEECTEADCLRWSILDNRFYRGFNELERAMLFVRLKDARPGLLRELEDTLADDLRPPKEPEVLAQYRALLGLPREIRDALALEEITMGQGLLLLKVPEECRGPFFFWIVQCSLNTNEARQAIQWALDSAYRDKREPEEYITSHLFHEIIASQSSPRHKAQQLLYTLRKARLPLLEHWKDRFEAAKRDAHIEKHAQVIHDPFFETAALTFQIHTSSEIELKDKLQSLLEAIELGKMRGLFRSVSVEETE